MLTSQGDGLAHCLALQHVADVHFFDEEELLDDHKSLLDHWDDRGVALGPGLRGLVDDAADRHSRDLDTIPVQLSLSDRLDNLGAGPDPHAAGRHTPLRDSQTFLDDLEDVVVLCREGNDIGCAVRGRIKNVEEDGFSRLSTGHF